MKKIFLSIFLFVTFFLPCFAQDYDQHMQSGKDLFYQNNYLDAMEQFDLAYLAAESDSTENESEYWKEKAKEKIKETFDAYNALKTNTESALRIVMNEPLSKTNANKKLYEIYKSRAISEFNKKNFYDAIQNFKLSKLCPDYKLDNEIDNFLLRSTDSLNSLKKIALVIGNANYVEGNLEKAIRDAKEVGEALQSMNFKIIEGYNLKSPEFDAKVKEFFEAAKGYDLILFFYTGFGYQSDQLLPVDTKTDAEGNLKKWFSLNYIMEEFLNYNRSNKIFIVDMDRTSKERNVPSVMAYPNCMVMYSTSPNSRAYNGVGHNSLFTEQFLKYLKLPNTSFQEIFRLSREATMRVSKNRQVPTIYDNIQNNIYLNWKLD